MASDPDQLAGLLSQCEKEPIHIPGAIQPFGVLLTVDPQRLLVQNVSENCAAAFGVSAPDLLGRPLSGLMSTQDPARLGVYLAAPDAGGQETVLVKLFPGDDKDARDWELRAHRHHDTLFVEAEPAVAGTPGLFQNAVREAVGALQSAGSVQELCDRAAQQVKKITGFDRVMIYRFDADWHGIVLSEACSPHVASYLGHHFPASDIPAQARAIFLQNWLRMIPDVDYLPSRIHPGTHPGSGAPLDLGKALLRSVSPVHLEYLRNMGVKASLTVSLVDNGRLWGLIACHHAAPLLVDRDTRAAAELVGRLVSTQLMIKEMQEDQHHRNRLGQARERLMRALEDEPDLTQGLPRHADKMLDMAGAEAGAVALCYGNEWTLVGPTPPVAELEKIVTWLVHAYPDAPVFETNRLSSYFPGAAAYKEVASGLLAMSIARAERDYVLWFRPEVTTTVTWAGAPDKPLRQSGDLLTLHPRASFESWKEVVTGTAIPWKSVEIAAVEGLRADIIALALQQEYRKEQEARQRAEQLSREKDEMVMMVSHDLKTPLSAVSMSIEFLRRFHPSTDKAVQRMVERGERATKMMDKLIANILDVAKIEAGTLDVDLKPEHAEDLIREVVNVSAPVANEKGVQLAAAPANAPCQVLCARHRIFQVLNNLVGNALKFTPPGGKVNVAVHAQQSEIVFSVADTGEGIPPQHIEKIFERYWQADDTRRQGTGLGLWIAKGIVERHGGRMWATSRPGAGSTFYFTLPQAGSQPGARP
ncbi:MAG TPA: ATP-binding protein [Noviherbaspirillum sp.]|uniref:ATP-binding protein n=1 Tax=Noviherbaspirillum sp. TaxID=1926288 RepID=UPI002D27232F|nr:ATP-binding protein [Noviherbaspirillum sp.]HYD93853.1 ATP-binding protein [Noviherbaspirillum sp.]